MNEQHTAKCRDRLPPEFQSQFSLLAQVFRRASRLWGGLLPAPIWALLTKHYVIGFQQREQSLYLFRLSLGLRGVGKATGYEKFAVSELRELDYQENFWAGTFSFRTPDGKKIKLFAPKASRENAGEIYQSLRVKV